MEDLVCTRKDTERLCDYNISFPRYSKGNSSQNQEFDPFSLNAFGFLNVESTSKNLALSFAAVYLESTLL